MGKEKVFLGLKKGISGQVTKGRHRYSKASVFNTIRKLENIKKLNNSVVYKKFLYIKKYK